MCEMGTGKTLMGIGTAHVLYKLKGIRRVFVMCPPHLVRKWIAEVKDSLHDAKVYNYNGRNVISFLNDDCLIPAQVKAGKTPEVAFDLEHGGENDVNANYRTVAFFYDAAP